MGFRFVGSVRAAHGAIQHNCTLLTHNTKDFTDMPGLAVTGVW